MIPQLLMVALFGMDLGMSLVKHGEPRDDYNFWHTSIGIVLSALLLWWGGFWGVWGL